jgi:sulfofructose kinase
MSAVVDVLCVGDNTLDHVFYTPGGWTTDAKVTARSHTVSAGGQAANAAWTFAGLGLRTHYVGVFGDDEAGGLSRQSLIEAGCALDGSLIVDDCRNHVAAVVVAEDSGHRSIVEYQDGRASLERVQIEDFWFSRARALYVDGHEPAAATQFAIAARSCRLPVFADLEDDSPAARELVRHVDELIAPRGVLEELATTSDPQATVSRVAAQGPRVVVGTDGARGAFGAARDEPVVFVPAPRVAVVDPTGAGDAFHAGYVAARLVGRDPVAAMRFGAHLGAAKCERRGPRLPRPALEAARADA